MLNYWEHLRTMFCLFLQYLCFQMPEMTKFFTDESCTQNRRIFSNVELLGTYESHVGTMFGPYQGHVLTISTITLLLDDLSGSNFHCMPNRRIPFSVKLLGPYKGHVWATLGPCFDYFYNNFASRCLKRLKLALESHESQIEEYHSM